MLEKESNMKNFITCTLFFLSTHAFSVFTEIELKIQLDQKQRQLFTQWLSDHAQCKGTVDHTEYYLDNPNDSYWIFDAGFKDSLKTVRVRLTPKGDSVCYKFRHVDPITKRATHRDEYETSVKDGLTMLEILTALGYTQQTIIKKTRCAYVYKEFEIVLDDVENIGSFIEIELKQPSEDVAVGRQRIENLLKAIGITEYTEFDRGYIHMAWNPECDFAIKNLIN